LPVKKYYASLVGYGLSCNKFFKSAKCGEAKARLRSSSFGEAKEASLDRPSKEGLRCGIKEQELPPWVTVDECSGLLLEHNHEQGLGIRCGKKSRTEGVWFDKRGKCGEFYPLEVLLSQAVEQNLLSPEQLEKIRIAISENPKEKSENQGVQEMTTLRNNIVSNTMIEIDPPVHVASNPAGAIEAMKALDEKRERIFTELIERHFPTFDNGEMKDRASRFINLLVKDDVVRVEIKIVYGESIKYAVWMQVFTRNGRIENFNDWGWAMSKIAKDVAYRFQAFLNLLEVQCFIVSDVTVRKS
jgi:hypothetical protein